MTSTKNHVYHPFPLVDGHMRSTWNGEIHIGFLKRIVGLQWHSGPRPEAEIQLHDCNLSKTVLLVIYITNLYRRKMSTFYSVQRRNSGKSDVNFFPWEDRMTSVDSNFNFLHERPHGAWLPPPFTCVHLILPPPFGRHKWMAPKELTMYAYNLLICYKLSDDGVSKLRLVVTTCIRPATEKVSGALVAGWNSPINLEL